MFRSLRHIALSLVFFGIAAAALAQSTAMGPGASGGGSLPEFGFSGDVRPAAPAPALAPAPRAFIEVPTTTLPVRTPSQPIVDPLVQPAVDVARPDDRRLAPRGKEATSFARRAEDGAAKSRVVPDLGVKTDTIYSTFTALAIVLGLFLLCIWLLRRGKKTNNSMLPTEVVSVLGKVAITPKQTAELLRIGNKLVLVALTPDGAKPLTEVTDPAEVDRLTGLCQKNDANSSTRAFEEVFRELSNTPVSAGFLGDEAPLVKSLPELPSLFSPRGVKARA